MFGIDCCSSSTLSSLVSSVEVVFLVVKFESYLPFAIFNSEDDRCAVAFRLLISSCFSIVVVFDSFICPTLLHPILVEEELYLVSGSILIIFENVGAN